LGKTPAFFEAAFANRAVLADVWRQTRVNWLRSPVPYSFRRAVVSRLAEESGPLWRVIANELQEEQQEHGADAGWPEPGTSEWDAVLMLTCRVVLGEADEAARTRLRDLLGPSRHASLIAVMGFLETCRAFAVADPGLAEQTAVLHPREAGRRGRAGPLSMSAAQLAFEGAPVGLAIAELDDQGHTAITEANLAMAILTARDRNALVGLSLRELAEPADADVDAELLARLLAGRIPSYEAEKRFRRPDGTVFWGTMRVSAIRTDDESRRPLYLVVELTDSTHYRHEEEALEARRDRLARAFEEAPTGMALATLEDRFLQSNDALCGMLGYTDAELVSKRLGDLIVKDDRPALDEYLRQLKTGEVLALQVEVRATRSDGEVVWVQLNVSVIHDDHGSPSYVLVQLQDIGERKRVQEELDQSEPLEGIPGLQSRARLFDRLEQARSRFQRTGSPFAVMFAAVDGLASLREAGAEIRDRVLAEISEGLLGTLRSGDTVASYTGAEFVILCEDLARDDDALAIASRLVEAGRLEPERGPGEVEARLTLGLAVATNTRDAAAALVERACAAMHHARRRGVRYQEYSAAV
jgi:PAS domain S-box-containing protein/diguanylate cyclase (GGDEF)-like protein